MSPFQYHRKGKRGQICSYSGAINFNHNPITLRYPPWYKYHAFLDIWTAPASQPAIMSLDQFWAWFPLVSSRVAVLLIERSLVRRGVANLPPGPFPLPFIRNAFDAPRKNLGRECSALVKKYGAFQ